MVAIIIIGAAFVGLIRPFPYALSISKTAENQTRAAYLAQAKIEELVMLNYENIATGTIEALHRLGPTGTYLYNFQRQSDIFLLDKDMNNTATDIGIKKLVVSVYYTNSLSKTENEYIVQTLFINKR